MRRQRRVAKIGIDELRPHRDGSTFALAELEETEARQGEGVVDGSIRFDTCDPGPGRLSGTQPTSTPPLSTASW